RGVAGALLSVAATVSISMACSTTAMAQVFKEPVRILVPAAAGGSSDILARLIAPGMSEVIGQPVVVENRPGAANNVGLGYVANSAADGYTIALVDVGAPAISASLFDDLTYDLAKDLVAVTMVTFTPYIVGMNPKLPA